MLYEPHPSARCICGTRVLYATRADATVTKVYAECANCGRDYGRVGTIEVDTVGSDAVDRRARDHVAQRVSG